MRRIPIFATILVALAVATMMGLGIWQLHRLRWKEGLLAQIDAAQTLPPLGETDLFRPNLGYRQAAVTCATAPVTPIERAGRSAEGRSGYVYLVPCRFTGGEVLLVAGWADHPGAIKTITNQGHFAGMLSGSGPMGQLGRLPYTLYSTTAIAPLVPAAQPSRDAIVNNHLAYAIQWFAFAAVAAMIYAIALWKRAGRIARKDKRG